jgi:hypothetical protein
MTAIINGIDIAANCTGSGPETLAILGWQLFYDYKRQIYQLDRLDGN